VSNIKTKDISEIDYAQLQYESNCWKRALSFMIEENIHLKNRLAEILKGDIDKKLLGRAESFQNRFIKADEFIRLLRDDLAVLDKLSALLTSNETNNPAEVDRRVKNIRGNMNRLENSMTRIKFQFNSQLLPNGST
jgi:RecA/RadA recombinase